jgi:hypothetical protein
VINLKSLNLGDVVYIVKERNNAFTKKKIKTVVDGVEWFRYDRDHWEYTVAEIVYCGHVTVINTGEVDPDPDRQNQMHFKYEDGNIYYEYEADIGDLAEWFHTRQEAENYAATMRELKNRE